MEWMAAVLAAEPTAMPKSMSRRLHWAGEFEFGGLAAQSFGVVEEFGAGGVPAGAAVVVGRVPARQQADEQDRVEGLGGGGVPEPDPLAAFPAAGAHPPGELAERGGIVGDDGFHEVRLACQEQLPARFRGGDRGGGHQLSDLADGGRAQFLVPNRAAHAGAGTWRWHQA